MASALESLNDNDLKQLITHHAAAAAEHVTSAGATPDNQPDPTS